MQTEEMSMKSKIIYIVFVCFITLLIWLGDEGHRPLAYTGSELLHSVGLIDAQSLHPTAPRGCFEKRGGGEYAAVCDE